MSTITQLPLAASAGSTPAASGVRRFPRSTTLAEALGREYDLPSPIWGEALAVGERVMLSGPQKRAKKTWILCGLAVSLAAARPYLGLPVSRPWRVLIVNAEVGEEHFVERLRNLVEAAALKDPEAGERIRLVHLRGSGVDLTDEVDRSWLVAEVREHRADVVILDPITEAAPTTDENDPRAVLALLQGVQDTLANEGVAVVITHHWAKGSTANGYAGGLKSRGASKWPEHQDVNIQCHPNDDGSVLLDFETRNRRAPESILAELGEDCMMHAIPRAFGRAPTGTQLGGTEGRILEALAAGPVQQKDLGDHLGLSKGEVSKRVAHLVRAGRVSQRRGDPARGEPSRGTMVELVSEDVFPVSTEEADHD